MQLQTHNQALTALVVDIDPRCILLNSHEDLLIVFKNLMVLQATYHEIHILTHKSLLALKDLSEIEITKFICNDCNTIEALNAPHVLLIHPSNFVIFKDPIKESEITKVPPPFYVARKKPHFSKQQNEAHQLLKNAIEKSLAQINPKELGSSLDSKYQRTKDLIEYTLNYKTLIADNDDNAHELFSIQFSLLCKILSEISLIKFNDRDFFSGWIEVHEKEPSPTISTPFFFISFSKDTPGTLQHVTLIPSQDILLNHTQSFSFRETITPGANLNPSIMVNTPDRYGIKFHDQLEITSKKILLHKVFYFNSGLTYEGNVPCSQFSLHLWLDDEIVMNDSELKNLSLHLEISHLFNITSPFFNIRYLTDMGGSTKEVYCIDDINNILTSEVQGGLKGIRCIDSVHNKIIDYRFQKVLRSLKISKVPNQYEGITDCILTFEIPLYSLKNFDSSNSMIFSSY